MFALLTHAFGLSAGKSSSYQKNLEFIAKDIGKELIPFLSKEEMLKHITPEERLIGLTPEELRKIKLLLEEKGQKESKVGLEMAGK